MEPSPAPRLVMDHLLSSLSAGASAAGRGVAVRDLPWNTSFIGDLLRDPGIEGGLRDAARAPYSDCRRITICNRCLSLDSPPSRCQGAGMFIRLTGPR